MSGLKSKLIISTCSTEKFKKLKEAFHTRGAELLHHPMIDIVQEKGNAVSSETFAKLDNFDWIIFTSSYGVSSFFALSEIYKVPSDIFGRIRFATIGKSTSRELLAYGYLADFENSGNTSLDMAKELIEVLGKESLNILHPTGNLSGTGILTVLGERHNLTRLFVYNTLPVKKTNPDIINRISKGDYDIILFFSPSAFHFFILKHEKVTLLHPMRIASIGKTTTMAIHELGFEPLVVAEESTMEGMINGLEAFYNNKTVTF